MSVVTKFTQVAFSQRFRVFFLELGLTWGSSFGNYLIALVCSERETLEGSLDPCLSGYCTCHRLPLA